MIREFFEKQRNYSEKLYSEWNSMFDCQVMPTEKETPRFYHNYDIPIEETILFIRDFSSWFDAIQGLVITDKAIYIHPEKKDRSQDMIVEWSDVHHVVINHLGQIELQDAAGNTICQIGGLFFLKKKSVNAKKINLVVELLREAAETMHSAEDDAYEQFKTKFAHIDNASEKLTYAQQTMAALPENSLLRASIAEEAGDFCMNNDDFEGAIRFYSSALEGGAIEDESVAFGDICFKIATCAASLENTAYARQCMLMGALYGDGEQYIEWEGKPTTIKAKAKEFFSDLDDIYVENFIEMPYKDRQKLMLVDSFTNLFQEHYATLCINDYPAELTFPVGHPVANSIYVAHPKVPTRYMPLEDYEIELVEDKIREYCQLVQALGATSIIITNAHTQLHSNASLQGRSVGGDVSVHGTGVGATKKKEYGQRVIDAVSRSISLKQKFNPQCRPYIPEGMVWFDSEPTWQRLARQRIEGNLLSHEERIATEKSRTIDNTEMKALRTEVFAHYARIGLEVGKYEEEIFTQAENAIISIKVQFASVDGLTATEENPSAPTTKKETAPKVTTPSDEDANMEQHTSNEEQYMKEFAELLAMGEIGALERKLLKRLASKLDISPILAEELEQKHLQSLLTEEEEEYIDTVRELMAAGSITDKQRKVLERLRGVLEIAPDRAVWLEQHYIQ